MRHMRIGSRAANRAKTHPRTMRGPEQPNFRKTIAPAGAAAVSCRRNVIAGVGYQVIEAITRKRDA